MRRTQDDRTAPLDKTLSTRTLSSESANKSSPIRPVRSSARPNRPSSYRAESSSTDAPAASTSTAGPVSAVTDSPPIRGSGSVYSSPEIASTPSPPLLRAHRSEIPPSSTPPLQFRKNFQLQAASTSDESADGVARPLSVNQFGKLPALDVSRSHTDLVSHFSPDTPLNPPLNSHFGQYPDSTYSVESTEALTNDPIRAVNGNALLALDKSPSLLPRHSPAVSVHSFDIPSRRSSLRRPENTAMTPNMTPLQTDLIYSDSNDSADVDMSSLYAAYAEGASPVATAPGPASEGGQSAASRERTFSEAVAAVSGDGPRGIAIDSSVLLMDELDRAIDDAETMPEMRRSSLVAALPMASLRIRQSRDLPVDAMPTTLDTVEHVASQGTPVAGAHLSPTSPDVPSLTFSSPPNLHLNLPSRSSSRMTGSPASQEKPLPDVDAASSGGYTESNYQDIQEDETLQTSPSPELRPLPEDQITSGPSSTTHGSPHSSIKQNFIPRSASMRSKASSAVINALDLSKLVRHRPLPASCRHKDIASMRTAGDRCIAYAQRINELSTEDTGINSWITFVRHRGKAGSLGPARNMARRFSDSPVLQQRTASTTGSTGSWGRYDSSTGSDAEGPARNPHTLIGNMPYSYLLSSATSSSSTLGYMHSASPQQNVHARPTGGFLSSLGRKGSSKRTATKTVISGPTLIRSSSGGVGGASRALDNSFDLPSVSKRASVSTPLANVAEAPARPLSFVSAEADILPDDTTPATAAL